MSLSNITFKVTIGLCVKNCAEIIEKAIISVLDQDFPKEHMEILVVDGNSKDKTLEILTQHLKDQQIQVRIFTENSGLGKARQMVVENSNAEYIIWMDADMILPRNYVSTHVNYMDSHENVGITAGRFHVHIGEGLAADLENIVYAVDSVYGEQSASKYGYLPGTEGSIFRTKAIRQINGFDVNMRGAAEDTEVSSRIVKSGWKVVKINNFFIESNRPTWSSLWLQYIWYGRGGHFIFHKNKDSINLWKMTPLAGFCAGIVRLPRAYLLTHKKFTFLLPVHYAYKRFAWSIGFLNAHFQGYGHFQNKEKNQPVNI